MSGLSEGDWQKIRALKLGLPDRARQEINNMIDLEVRVLHSKKRPAETRAKLRHLHDLAAKLSRELIEIDSHTIAALTDMGSSRPRGKHDALELLHQYQAQLCALVKWMHSAAASIKDGKRGPDGEGSEWLVRQCAALLVRHGAGQISRSYKAKDEVAFAKIVLQAAARAAGRKLPKSGTGAIRRVVHAQGRIGAKKRG